MEKHRLILAVSALFTAFVVSMQTELKLELVQTTSTAIRPSYKDTFGNLYALCKYTSNDIHGPATTILNVEEKKQMSDYLTLKSINTVIIDNKQETKTNLYCSQSIIKIFQIFKLSSPDCNGNKYALVWFPYDAVPIQGLKK